MMVAAATILMGSAALPAQAQAPDGDWVQVYDHASGLIFMDQSSVRREGNIVTLRSRVVFNEPPEDGPKTVVTRFRYDCAARTAELLWMEQLRTDGSRISEGEIPADQREVEPIPADSANAAIAGRVCS